jgi:ribosomal protein S18 acetylase RimI-like enzyme
MQSEVADKKGASREHPVVFGELTEKNVGQLRLLNTVVFPVNYNDTFYRDLLNDPTLTRLALFNDVLVGAVCCRVENKQSGAGKRLYIMTLGVLAPYRQMQIGKPNL